MKIEGIDSEGTTKNQDVLGWIKDGADFEDAGNLFTGRFYNHFHNPLHQSPWNQAGLDDVLVPFPLLIPIFVEGESSLLWAQDDQNNADWNWQTIRGHYFEAMTSPKDKDRQIRVAKLFEGIGHMIHLVQDMAQPAHVRNDAHPLDGKGLVQGLESWAVGKEALVGDILKTSTIFPTLSFDSLAGGLAPIMQFWDTDQYDGTVGTLPLTRGTTVGLSEYTNANFFSDDTIDSFLSRHQFPFPSNNPADYNICEDAAPPNSSATKRKYWSRTDCNAYPLDHFVAISVIAPSKGRAGRTYPVLDSKVHEDYANALLPRAVGYSAGLIDYFFRGQFAVIPAEGGITIRNDGDENLGLDPVTNEIKGTLSIYYDDTTSTRHELATLDLATVVAPSPLHPGQMTELIPFLHPKDNLVAGRYIIVYRGPLGAEQDAVIGKVTAPLQVFYRGDEKGAEKIYRIGIDGSHKTLVFDNTDENKVIGEMEISPDMTRLAFTYGQSIHIIDLITGQDSPLIEGSVTTPTWSSDGSEMVYDKGFGCSLPCIPPVEIIKRNLALGSETQVTSQVEAGFDRRSPVNTQPAWSPDGQRIAYSMQLHEGVIDTKRPDCINGYVIALIDPFGQPNGRLSCSASIAYNDREPAWSPDNKEVVFSRQQLGMELGQEIAQLYKVSVLGGIPIKLTESAGPGFLERDPAWSPEGGLIALGSTRDGDFDIWLVDASSGKYLLNLTDGNLDVNGKPAIDSNPAFGWMP